MANLLELAEMCSAVYEVDESDPDYKKKLLRKGLMVSGWTCTEFKRAGGSLNGFQAAIFSKNGEQVVAFRGTAQMMDVAADLKLGTGMNSTYFDEGEIFAARATGNTVIVTGHSLGGAIAQIVANRGGYTMATFNAPGVGVIASKNIGKSNSSMNVIRLGGMLASIIRHPIQAGKDVWNAFNVVKGVNLRLQFDAVSNIGNHYGTVKTITGMGMNPINEHGISTMIKVLKQSHNKNLAASQPSFF